MPTVRGKELTDREALEHLRDGLMQEVGDFKLISADHDPDLHAKKHADYAAYRTQTLKSLCLIESLLLNARDTNPKESQ